MPKIFPDLGNPQVADLLKQGGVGVIPTDTVYGLAALAGSPAATQRLYTLKQREQKPGTLIAANIQQLIELGLDKSTLRAVEHFWPNPLSIIILAAANLNYLHQGLGDLAVRIPNHKPLLELLKQTGPLVTSSANQPGLPPANNLAEAQKYFGSQVDFYVDGGDFSNKQPSTLARFEGGQLQILRQGAFKQVTRQ